MLRSKICWKQFWAGQLFWIHDPYWIWPFSGLKSVPHDQKWCWLYPQQGIVMPWFVSTGVQVHWPQKMEESWKNAKNQFSRPNLQGLVRLRGAKIWSKGRILVLFGLVAVITVYFFRVFGSTFHKYTKIYSILLGVHQPLLPKFVPVELPLPKVH